MYELGNNPLEASQVKALRNADSILYRYSVAEDLCVLECMKKVDVGDGFGDRELRVEIPVSPQFTQYEEFNDGLRREITNACWIFSSARFIPQLVTALSLLRKEDRIQIHVIAGNSNGVTNEADLVTDEIYLKVHRSVNGNGTVLTFLLDTITYKKHGNFMRNVTYDFARMNA